MSLQIYPSILNVSNSMNIRATYKKVALANSKFSISVYPLISANNPSTRTFFLDSWGEGKNKFPKYELEKILEKSLIYQAEELWETLCFQSGDGNTDQSLCTFRLLHNGIIFSSQRACACLAYLCL
jgi:hypothetical protein